MIIVLDTSTSECRLSLATPEGMKETTWQAERQLAKGLLSFIYETLSSHGANISDIEGIGVFRGPGSFTGLRIGLTVMNTLADAMAIPIVGTAGSDWQREALDRLRTGNNDRIVLPLYGSEANITKPRK